MGLWAVTMVKDELDVLPFTMAHLASEGVEGIIVADNLSTDGTWEWLQEYKESFVCEVVLVRDEEVGYYQSAKMTKLALQALDFGATWVLPVDADECWYNPTAKLTLADTVAGAQGDCLQCTLYNYFPTSTDISGMLNPFQRIVHRDVVGANLQKVLVRAGEDVVIAQGNHDASAPESFRKYTSPIQVAHFPWRSPEQFERKVRNGYAAYQATDLASEVGAHWRQYGALLESGGTEALRALYGTWFLDPALALVRQPALWHRFS